MKVKTNKLFKVVLKQPTWKFKGPDYKNYYVVSRNPDDAYEKVHSFLQEKGVLSDKEKELDYVQLIAEADNYPDCDTFLID